MADRFPLILNTSANQIQEIASGDTLDLSGTNIKGVGIITATNISGNIIAGAGASNIISGILTAVAADIDDFVDVGSNIQLGNAGVITATTFKGDGDFVELDVDGHTNLDNLSVAGVSTFVGNINGKDIILTDTTPAISFIDSNANSDYRIIADNGVLSFADITNNANRINLFSNGTVAVQQHLDVGAGVDVTGNITATGNVSGVDGTFTGNVSIGGTLTYEDVTNIDSVGIVTARNGLKVTGGTSNFSGASHFVGVANFNETIVGTARTAIKLTCTDESTDTTTYPLFVAATTGDQFPKTGTNLSFNSANGTLTATTFSGSGASLTNLPAAQLSGTAAAINGSNITNLNGSAIASGTVPVARIGTGTKNTTTFYRGDGTFQVVNTDLVSDTSPQLGGNLDCNNFVVTLNDSTGAGNNRLKIGNAGDLQLFHLSDANYVSGEVDGKDLYVRSRRDLHLVCGNNAGGYRNVIYADNNGTARLYHPASSAVRLQTSTAGVSITGRVTADDITIENTSGNLSANFTATNGLGTLEVGGSTGAFIDLKHPATDDFDVRLGVNGTNGYLNIVNNFTLSTNGKNSLYAAADASTKLYHNGNERLETTNTGSKTTGYHQQTAPIGFCAYRRDTGTNDEYPMMDSANAAITGGYFGQSSIQTPRGQLTTNTSYDNNGSGGSCFSHDGTKFTAPVAGVYTFTVNIALYVRDAVGSDNSVGWGFFKNQSKFGWGTYDSGLSMSQSTPWLLKDGSTTLSSAYEIGSPSITTIMELASGDEIQFGWQNMSIILGVRSFIFSGHLLG